MSVWRTRSYWLWRSDWPMVCHQQASSHEIDYFSSVTISTSMQRCSSPSHVVADIWSHWLQLPLKVYLLTYCFTYLQLTTYGALWLFAVQHHKIIYFIVIYFKIYQSTAWNSKNNMHHIITIPELIANAGTHRLSMANTSDNNTKRRKNNAHYLLTYLLACLRTRRWCT